MEDVENLRASIEAQTKATRNHTKTLVEVNQTMTAMNGKLIQIIQFGQGRELRYYSIIVLLVMALLAVIGVKLAFPVA